MKIRIKVAKFSGQRKILEIPKSIRDNFRIGENLVVSLYNKKRKKKKTRRG